MNICTCHISELRCKCEKCELIRKAREIFKSEFAEMLGNTFEKLHALGFEKKKCIRALRRECNHKNELQYDIFDVMANAVWRD